MRQPPDLDHLLARVRSLTTIYRAGRPDAFEALRDLVSFLLNLTVLAPSGGLRLVRGREPDRAVLGGTEDPLAPLPLRDGRFLRLTISMVIQPTTEGRRLKISQSSYQYQMDQTGDRWVFRYEYLRYGTEQHPPAHLQVRAGPLEGGLVSWRPFERVHFPTGRVSLEAIIRLLVEEFGVPCNRPDVWRRVLSESEKMFLEIAHQPRSDQDA